MLKYREKFNLSWVDIINVPMTVVKQDLEMFDIEDSVVKYNQSGSQADLNKLPAKVKKPNANIKR